MTRCDNSRSEMQVRNALLIHVKGAGNQTHALKLRSAVPVVSARNRLATETRSAVGNAAQRVISKYYVSGSAAKARKLRFQIFAEYAEHLRSQIGRPLRILDVGGEVRFWSACGYLPSAHVTILNVNPESDGPLPHGFAYCQGSALELPFSDQSFDVAFSNSVLGHVGGWNEQKIMADEMRRVAPFLFLQTPNHYFAIDWRTRIPLFHFMPDWLQVALVARFKIGYCGGHGPEVAKGWLRAARNIRGEKELRDLFPECSILQERVRFIGVKSFIALSPRHALICPSLCGDGSSVVARGF